MENYFKTSKNLKRSDRDLSVVRRSNSIEPPPRNTDIHQEQKIEKKKIAYKTDIVELKEKLEEIKNERSNLIEQIDELKNTIEKLKTDEEQTKTERLKIKLDNFINSYNENEIAHSEEIKNLQIELNELNLRLKDVEEIL